MTYDDVAKDNDRFAAYLRANGKRVVASLLLVADDHDNTSAVISRGSAEAKQDLALSALADMAGCKLVRL